jgi:two-component system sensor histidine kinase RpfC
MMINRQILAILVLVTASLLAFSGESSAQDFYFGGLPWLCAYLLAVALFQLHIARRPGPSPARRIVAICADAAVISFGLRQGDAASAYLIPLYFWMILGNGVRLGARYMGAAVASSAAGFAANVWLTSFWHFHIALSAGLFASLIIIPIYSGLLLRRLAEARAEAERANHAKTLLLACVSHELRTPLTAIVGLGALLQKTRLDFAQREMVQTLSDASGMLLRHIGALLTVARDEIGRESEKPDVDQRVDLFALLVALRGLLAVEADKKGVRLGLCIDADTPRYVLTEPALLLDVLQNLGGNAVKFTRAGAVAIHVGVCDRAAAKLKFEVRDSGLGIEKSAQARIFESFVQADPGISSRFGGSGLGLAIARRRLEARGGRIGVDSAPGRGSRFWFELTVGRVFEGVSQADGVGSREPEQERLAAFDANGESGGEAEGDLHHPQSSEPACVAFPSPCYPLALARRRSITVVARADDPEDQAQGREIAARPRELLTAPAGTTAATVMSPTRSEVWTPLRLLLAEDNGVNRMVLEKILVQAGHSTKTVADGEAALEAMLKERFDVILLDANMPGIEGPEVARLYRFAALRAHAPIIALTADASSACREDCLRAGMVACLIKPLTPDALLAAIADAYAKSPGDAEIPVRPENRARPPAQTFGDAEPLDAQTLAGLARLGGDEFLRELIGQFLVEGKQIVESMAEAVENGDIQSFQHKAHALASSAGNVGAEGLARLCRSWREVEMREFALYGDDCLDDLKLEWARVATLLGRAAAASPRRRADLSRRDNAA